MEFNAKAVFQNQNLGKHHALRNPQETPPSPQFVDIIFCEPLTFVQVNRLNH